MAKHDRGAQAAAPYGTEGMRIGVLGGTFNPIHTGHLILAEQVREARELDKVLFIPAYSPPHKAAGEMAGPEHRLRMTRLAVEGNPRFEVSEIELRRMGTSYTFETIMQLRAQQPADSFFFIIGADTLPELPSWFRFRDLLDACTILVGVRPRHDLDWAPLEKALAPEKAAKLRTGVVCTTPIGISSSDVRARVRLGSTIRYIVPEAVADHILRHKLYAEAAG